MYSGLIIMRTGSPGASRTKMKLRIVMPINTGMEINKRRANHRYIRDQSIRFNVSVDPGPLARPRGSNGRHVVVELGQVGFYGVTFHSEAFQKP